MRYGISLLPDCRPEVRSATAYYADALRLARLADESGVDYVKMTEHYLHPYGGYCPSPLTFLAAVAAVTRDIRLMTGGILPAFHHPVQVAAQTAMVDALSGGRLDVGFARAFLPYEFAAFGVPLDESRARFEATVAAVVRLWTEPEVTEQTPYFAFEGARSLPRPVQSPHPPVWVAAVRSRQSFAWIGEQGFHLLVTPGVSPLTDVRDYVAVYREAFADSQPPGTTSRVAASIPLYVAESSQAALAEAGPRLREYLDVWADAAESWRHVESADYVGYAQLPRLLRGTTVERLRENGGAVLGSPDEVADRTAGLAELLDLDAVLWQVDYGGMPGSPAERSLELFLDKVRPQVGVR